MSNFKCTIKVKKTGEIKEVYAQDNFFGSHQYGYSDGEKVYKEEEIEIMKELRNKEQIIQFLEKLQQEQEVDNGDREHCTCLAFAIDFLKKGQAYEENKDFYLQ